jgi:hypothetical protein
MIPYQRKILLASLAIALVSCGKETSAPPIPPAASAKVPEGSTVVSPPSGNRWAEDLAQVQSYPDYGERRAWGYAEIAQRHKALVLKELPAYITRLRGGGAREEWEGTSAAWYFRVPSEHLADFENYLVELGVPRDALHEKKHIALERGTPGQATDRLLYGTTMISNAEGDLMGVQFGESVAGATY